MEHTRLWKPLCGQLETTDPGVPAVPGMVSGQLSWQVRPQVQCVEQTLPDGLVFIDSERIVAQPSVTGCVIARQCL
jgi:hypothetical protein